MSQKQLIKLCLWFDAESWSVEELEWSLNNAIGDKKPKGYEGYAIT